MPGKIEMIQTGTDPMITLNADTGTISAGGKPQVQMLGVKGQRGELVLWDEFGHPNASLSTTQLLFRADPSQGQLIGSVMMKLDGQLLDMAINGHSRILLDAADANIYLGGNGMGADIFLYSAEGNFKGGTTTVPSLWLSGDNGSVVAKPKPGIGAVIIKNDAGDEVLRLDIAHGPVADPDQIGVSGGGRIVLKNEFLKETVVLDGQRGDVVLNQADCAEEFDVSQDTSVEPGTVVVFDEEGQLRPSDAPYDHKVAGVVSGAGDFRPAIILDKNDQRAGRLPVSLTGKVFCKADARYAEIKVGDLLTTSATLGHAMKALDSAKAFGAVIGKAMRPLSGGQGLIPILIALQ